ncbi:MAG: septation protein A [Betaproteobacteria bacterium]|jgi:Intracellular septation protein A|nr:septation protein A [Betaproteobacteria bacterium]
MKIFFDLFPVGLFFLAYQWGGIYWATGSAIAASTLQIITLLLLRRHVDATAWIGFVVIALFGGLTLWTHLHPVAGVDATLFIRWKPTVLYWIFAAILALGPLLFQRNPMKSLLSQQLPLPDHIWTRLNLTWSLFFVALGALNLYVAFTFSEAIWVKFKLFGLMALMLVFIIGQGIYLSRFIEDRS